MNSELNIALTRAAVARDVILATRFLSTLSRVPDIRGQLADAAGYGEPDHERGWYLLRATTKYRRRFMAPSKPVAQEEALLALDAWDGMAFDRTRATLRYAFPDQHDYIFDGLTAEVGSGAMRSVRTYVDRVVALRDGTDPAREGQREADRAAAQLLAARKIFDEKVEARLEELLTQAETLAPAPETATPEEDAAFARVAAELHAWLYDWRGQARAVITRGDHRMRLGLISRRTRSEEDEVIAEEEAAEQGSKDASAAETGTTV